MEILAGMIYAEALGLKNRPKTGIQDGRGLEYLIRIVCDGTRGMANVAGMGFMYFMVMFFVIMIE